MAAPATLVDSLVGQAPTRRAPKLLNALAQGHTLAQGDAPQSPIYHHKDGLPLDMVVQLGHVGQDGHHDVAHPGHVQPRRQPQPDRRPE